MTTFSVPEENIISVNLEGSSIQLSLDSSVVSPVVISNDISSIQINIDRNVVITNQGGAGSGGGGTGFVDQSQWLVAQKIALTDMSALSLVRMYDKDTFQLATNNGNYSMASVVGILIEGGLAGSKIRALIMGDIEDPSFTFPSDSLLFLGLSGIITSTAPSSGFSTLIGTSPALGMISLQINRPIKL